MRIWALMDAEGPVPEPVRDLAAGDAVRLVWHNELDGLTLGVLLEAYGADPDPDRTWYYRLLWDLGP